MGPSCPNYRPPGRIDTVSQRPSTTPGRIDAVSQRPRRWTRKPLGSARKGSNPLGLGEHLGPQSFLGICPQRFESPRAWRASRPPKLPPLPGTPRSREHWRGRFAETGSIGGSALPRRGRVCSSRLPLGCAGLADLLSYWKKENPIFLETCTSPQVCPSGGRCPSGLFLECSVRPRSPR